MGWKTVKLNQSIFSAFSFYFSHTLFWVQCAGGGGCRIHRLHLCSGGLGPSRNDCPVLNNLMTWHQPWRFGECWVPLYCHYSQVHSDVVPDRVLSLCQIEKTVCKQMIGVTLWLLYRKIWKHLTVCAKKSSGLFKNVIYKMCLQTIHI